MINIIVELSKYMIIVLMAVYTFSCFSVFIQEHVKKEKHILIRQNVLMFLIQFLAYLVMYLKTKEPKLVFFYLAQLIFMIAAIALYSIIYPKVSRLIVNNMCMLISIGLIMITRLNFESAVKQFVFVVLGVTFGLIVPVLIRKMKFLADWTYVYAGFGIAALLLVAVFAVTSGGAKLGFTIAGFGIQPSEFVKILFVFYVAGSLSKSTDFKNIVITTVLAAAHVLILVLSTDLGAALILFVVYLVMLYVATRQPLYAVAGLGAGSLAAVAGYHLFSHIKVRVSVWKDPFAYYRFKLEETDPEFLTMDEIKIILAKEFTIKRVEQVRDVFVFCIFTGLAFSDVKDLSPEHLVKDNKGELWIRKNRQKTKIMCNIPVLPVAASILDKYKDVAECTGKLLPVLCNQRMNSYLKEIADVCGIHKNLSTHTAKHNVFVI